MEVESEEEEDYEIMEEIEENESPIKMNNIFSSNIFSPLTNGKLSLNDNEFNSKIFSETRKMNSYLMESIKNFQKLFDDNLSSFPDLLSYLEKRAVPNECICAGVIDTIPGWRCADCSTYENSIYCNDCYKNSKDLHKNHTMYFLYSSGGMCDCGDPGSVKIFCHKHSGPFQNSKQIQKFIEKSFSEKEIKNLKVFFDEFFYKFSRYFFLLEGYDLFYNEYFFEVYPPHEQNENEEIKNDIILLKKDFCIVFQNFLNFLRLISQKNTGMLHLLANYFLKNNLYLNSKEENEEYMTKHKCYRLDNNDITILYEKGEIHKCVCPFIRLFISNYREEIKSKENENEEFILSFPKNLPLKNAYCFTFFFLYDETLLNNNIDVVYNRNQFFSEDNLELLATKTNLIELSYDRFYSNLKEALLSLKFKDKTGNINISKLNAIIRRAQIMEIDTKYYSKPKIKNLYSEKTFIVKKIIDSICLVHNQIVFKSIYPHPIFQNSKSFSEEFLKIELSLLHILEDINMYFNWNNLDYSEEIFKYIIYKIMNQEKEGIKQLKENELSFHLSLYRCFGLLINYFCFNYSIENNCTIMESIITFKKFFESKEEIEIFVEKIKNAYFLLFGFIGGIKNNYFNYYELMDNYPHNYTYKNIFIKIDFCALKYLFALSEKKLDINQYLKISNIENNFHIFSNLFLEEKDNKDINNDLLGDQNLILNPIKGENEDNLFGLKNKKILTYDSDKTNYTMQLIFLLDIIIKFMRDDSCHYYSLMRQYDEILSSQTKKELFDIIKNNKDTFDDLKNILIENIICKMISNGNLVDLRMLKKHINQNLLYIFEEKNAFEKILDELTENKMKGEIKIFYLKDKYLNNLDMEYYINPNDKSKAQRYIQNFKKDDFKLYNKHFNNVSKLSFDFLENVYEKILLNKNNLVLFKKIIENLNENKEKLWEFDRKSLRSSLLPIIINYLEIFSIINTKSFISFKNENEEIIKEIKDILLISINNNKNYELFGKDLEENIQLLISELDYYKIIFNNINDDFSKLNKYDFTVNYIRKIKKDNKEDNSTDFNNINDQKIKNKKLKEKYKFIMKKNASNFIEKAIADKNIENNLKTEIEEDKQEGKNNEIICFYCRNIIQLNSWEKPYGKTGLFINDYFYSNSIKATLRNEINKINNVNENIIYDNYFWENKNTDKKGRIVSCGHYFHYDCINIIDDNFSCPLCLKKLNIIIPPLNILKNEYGFLSGEKIETLENPEEKEENEVNIDDNLNLFFNYVIDFLQTSNLFRMESNTGLIDIFYGEYKNHFNFLENIFFSEGSTFNKRQQIDNLQNIILSFRYLVKVSKIQLTGIKLYIKVNLSLLLNNSEENNIIKNCQDMYYVQIFEKILLSLSILFDYDELKQTFKYLIYIFLPYFSFGNYLKNLIIKDISLETINKDNFKKFIIENNGEMIHIFEILLKKLTLIKLITDYNNKNDDVIESLNKLTIEQILSILNMDNLYLLLKNDNKTISFLDIFKYLPKLFNLNDILFKEYKNDFDKIFNTIIGKVIINSGKPNLTRELIINFEPIKFNFIKLDNKVFDWIENNLEKKCKICSKNSKYNYICLICGEKICHTKDCNLFTKHAKLCNGNDSIFIDMDNMKICISFKLRFMSYIFPLYLNENGIGPNGYQMGNQFILSDENLKSAVKKFISYDLFFK